jgi:organic radical activating enzyme
VDIYSIYPAYLGEQNKYGIGNSAIIIRFQGCNVRCYKETLGTLCDSPEGLEFDGGRRLNMPALKEEIKKHTDKGIDTILITGGEPMLYQSTVESICEELANYKLIVETNGTLDISRSLIQLPFVNFIIDYKLQSTGVRRNAFNKFKNVIKQDDYIKFVVYDELDYIQMRTLVEEGYFQKGRLVAGAFWGSEYMDGNKLFEYLYRDGLLGKVELNVQLHKLLHSADYSKKDFKVEI